MQQIQLPTPPWAQRLWGNQKKRGGKPIFWDFWIGGKNAKELWFWKNTSMYIMYIYIFFFCFPGNSKKIVDVGGWSIEREHCNIDFSWPQFCNQWDECMRWKTPQRFLSYQQGFLVRKPPTKKEWNLRGFSKPEVTSSWDVGSRSKGLSFFFKKFVDG